MSQSAWTVGAQLSTSNTAPDLLSPARVETILNTALANAPLGILIVGTREAPDLFNLATQIGRARGFETYVWYNLLSDVEGCEDSELVIDWRGRRSAGWGRWNQAHSGVEESFRFVCPNNPSVRAKTLGRLEYLLTRYPFDGVFLDKCRFPSPANGVAEMFSCFCDHCRKAAAARELDLAQVGMMFESRGLAGQLRRGKPALPADAGWPDILIAPDGLLGRFMKFRADSITGLIGEAHRMTQRLERKLALDLFSAGLAPVVGQDYAGLSRLAAWTKPMTYRKALGPASLRLEIPALFEGLAEFCGIPAEPIETWAAENLSRFPRGALGAMRKDGVPYPLMSAEIAAAVREMDGVPVYAGVETVAFPGIIEADAAMVREMVRTARASGASGVIASWDLVYTPEESLLALAGDPEP